jgi:hypothetical protein
LPGVSFHIISFDVPDPPDYGGAIDIFYKIKSLWEAGCEIYLHCFQYGRNRSEILEQYCTKVWYYERAMGLNGLSISLPYIVSSRRDEKLLGRLLQYDAPIIFEGIHTTYYLNHPSISCRVKILRTHNIEHEYYGHLSSKTTNIFKKSYFYIESILLNAREKNLQNVNGFLELSLEDKKYFEGIYPAALHAFRPPFHPFKTDDIPLGTGKFCLYHGNLSHPENIEAVHYLVSEVIPNINSPFIIAGKNPSKNMQQAVNKTENCTLVSNPSLGQMNGLIKDAHIHVLPTFQSSGMKLKLLYALFNGRYVIVNESMLHGTGLNSICMIANTPAAIVATINNLMNQPFSTSDKKAREEVLNKNYNNAVNAAGIITFLQQISL